MTAPIWLTVRQAAHLAGVGPDKIRAAIHSDGTNPHNPPLTAYRDGRGFRIIRDDLDQWLRTFPPA